MHLRIGGAKGKSVLILVFLIFTLGCLLRFYGLSNQSLWLNELSSLRRSKYDSLSEVIVKGAYHDVHPPGYYILLHFVVKHVGDSESDLRFLSAVAGALSIFAMFLLGRRIYSCREGIIASAFVAVLWCPIYYSQEARSYSLLLLSTLLATYFWISLLKSLNENSKLHHFALFGYIGVSILSSYLHYYGFYLVGLQGLGAFIYFFRRKRALVKVLLIYLSILLAYSPWFSAVWYHLHKGPIWIGNPNITFFIGYLKFIFNKSWTVLLLVIALYLSLIISKIYKILKHKYNRSIRNMILSPDCLLILWLILPFAGAYLFSELFFPVLTKKYLIISLPAAYLLLSRSITQLPIRLKYQTALTLALIGLLLFHLVFQMDYYSKPHKQQFREAVYYIVEQDELYNDSLIISRIYVKDYFNYYFKKKEYEDNVTIIRVKGIGLSAAVEGMVKENPRYVWHVDKTPYSTEILGFMGDSFTLIDSKTFEVIEVRLYENQGVT